MLVAKLKALFQSLSNWFLRGNNRVKLFFLFISLFLWFIIKLSQTGYRSPSTFTIEYSDLPSNRILLEEGPKSVEMELQGSGFSLLRYKWFNGSKLKIDINSLPELKDGRKYWLSNENRLTVEGELNMDGTQIVKISPDTLFFNLGRLMSKKVPIVARYRCNFDTNQYVLYRPLQLKPDSVLITASAQELWKLDEIFTELIDISEPLDSLQVKVRLQLPKSENLVAKQEEVQAAFQFSSLAEAKIEVPIIAINNPDSTLFEIIPNKAELVYRTALRDFKEIRADEFLVYADFNDIADKPDARFISLKIENPPDAVRFLQISPLRVEFIISPL